MAGKLIIFSAPSGSGKSTIINYLLKQDLHLRFSISATSRDGKMQVQILLQQEIDDSGFARTGRRGEYDQFASHISFL